VFDQLRVESEETPTHYGFSAFLCYTFGLSATAYDLITENRSGGSFWLGDPGSTLNPFQYLTDPLFLLACTVYACNRWALKPYVHSAFLHNHFNDCLLIPCALPPLLLMQRWLRLRQHDLPPTAGEIGLYLLVWSILFEVIGPWIVPWTVADPWDVVAYVAGGILAGLWWHKEQLAGRRKADEL
jgi:hypothetical protein